MKGDTTKRCLMRGRLTDDLRDHAMKFIIKRSGKQFWFRIVSRNGRILANSERYKTEAAAMRAIGVIVQSAAWAPVVVAK